MCDTILNVSNIRSRLAGPPCRVLLRIVRKGLSTKIVGNNYDKFLH